MQTAAHALACGLALCALTACGEPPPPATPASIEECEKFFETVSAAFSSGSAKKAAACFDIRALLEKAMRKRLSNTDAVKIQKGFLEGATKPNGVFDSFASLGKSGTVKVLRTRRVEGRTRMLVRAAGDNGVNYLDMDVTKHPETGALKAADVYIFLSAEDLSTTMRRAMLPHLKRKKGFARLFTEDDVEVKHSKDLLNVARLVRESRMRAAITAFDELPEKLRFRKHLLFMRLNAASSLDDDKEYEKTLDLFRSKHPKDACIDMLSIDYYTMRKDYDAAVACIHRVDAAVGGDPYLKMAEAVLWLAAEQHKKAREAAEAALRAEPELEGLHSTMLDIALAGERFDDAIKHIDELERRGTEWSLEAMKASEEWAPFLASEEGKAWAEKRKGAGK